MAIAVILRMACMIVAYSSRTSRVMEAKMVLQPSARVSADTILAQDSFAPLAYSIDVNDSLSMLQPYMHLYMYMHVDSQFIRGNNIHMHKL